MSLVESKLTFRVSVAVLTTVLIYRFLDSIAIVAADSYFLLERVIGRANRNARSRLLAVGINLRRRRGRSFRLLGQHLRRRIAKRLFSRCVAIGSNLHG